MSVLQPGDRSWKRFMQTGPGLLGVRRAGLAVRSGNGRSKKRGGRHLIACQVSCLGVARSPGVNGHFLSLFGRTGISGQSRLTAAIKSVRGFCTPLETACLSFRSGVSVSLNLRGSNQTGISFPSYFPSVSFSLFCRCPHSPQP